MPLLNLDALIQRLCYNRVRILALTEGKYPLFRELALEVSN